MFVRLLQVQCWSSCRLDALIAYTLARVTTFQDRSSQARVARAHFALAMASLSEDRVKKLARRLASRVEEGETGSQQFQADLLEHRACQEVQRAAGKKASAGKHAAKLAPLLAALPEEQRVLGLHIAEEHHATREVVQADGDVTRGEIRELKRGRFIEIESASAKQLQATILELQDAKAKKVKADRAQRDAAKETAERYRLLSTEALRAELDGRGMESGGSKAALLRRLVSAPPSEVPANGREEADGSEAAPATRPPRDAPPAKRPCPSEAAATSGCSTGQGSSRSCPAEGAAAAGLADQPPMPGSSLAAEPVAREELWGKILVGYRRSALASELADELLKWAEERVQAGEPPRSRIRRLL